VNYLESHFWKRAREWFNASRLAFLGFTIRACVVSLLFAYIFYILLKALFRFPGYWEYSASAIVVSGIAFTAVRYLSCGKVRLSNLFKYFYIPASGGMGVLVTNFFSENLVNFLGAIVSMLTAA
jgi:hypothetical protein